MPQLEYTEEQMLELADRVIKSQIAVTGVQPKLSLEIAKNPENHKERRFTIVGLWGLYLKATNKTIPEFIIALLLVFGSLCWLILLAKWEFPLY